MTDVRTSTVYLVLEKAAWRWDPPRIVAMRKEKPALKRGQVAVKVKLNVDMDMFETFIPIVETTIAPGNIIEPEIELEVVND